MTFALADPWLLAHEPTVRLAAFGAVFAVFAILERLRPRRTPTAPTAARRLSNLGLLGVDVVLLRFVAPAGAVGAALVAQEKGIGLFHHVDAPAWLEALLAVVALDLLIYAQHVAFHRVPFFWRFHRVHHADMDLDVTSGIRFHPGEILLSLGWKVLVIAALGASPAAVIVFEVVLNGMSLITHANLRLPLALDRALRFVLVTPDMHRIHHSVRREETDSNYGFSVAVWDRLFGTYRADPEGGQLGMTIGLEDERDPRSSVALAGLLRMPFRAAPRPDVGRADDRTPLDPS